MSSLSLLLKLREETRKPLEPCRLVASTDADMSVNDLPIYQVWTLQGWKESSFHLCTLPGPDTRADLPKDKGTRLSSRAYCTYR